MSLIRFPLELPPVEKKPEPWRKVLLAGAVLIFVILVYIVAASLGQM